LVLRIERRVVEDELHDLEQVVADDVEVRPAHRRESDWRDGLRLSALVHRKRHELDRLASVVGHSQVLRIERRHLPDHRFGAQLDERTDVERIVVRAGDLARGVVLQRGIGHHGVPAALLHR
jgi:hypothetical protein